MHIKVRMVLLWCLLPGLAVVSGATARPDSQEIATLQLSGEGKTSSFETKQTEPATLLYLEHDGPYWRLGPLVDQVAEIATAESVVGDLFIRYPGDPLARRAARGKIHVGIMTTGKPPALPPFKEERMEATLVAYVTTTLPASRTAPLHTALRRWAVERGYGVLGPIVEIYRPSESNAMAAISELVIEIQVPIRPLSAPAKPTSLDTEQVPSLRMPHPSPDQADLLVAREPLSPGRVEVDHQPDPEIFRQEVPAEPVAKTQRPKDAPESFQPATHEADEPTPALPTPTLLNSYHDLNKALSAGDERSDREVRDTASQTPHRATLPERAEPSPARATPPATPAKSSPTATKAEQSSPKTTSAKATTKPVEPAPDEAKTILKLVQAGDFDGAARSVVPSHITQSAEDLAWIQQVIIRAEAIARGVRQVYPDTETPLVPLAEALGARYERLPLVRSTSAQPLIVVRPAGSHHKRTDSRRDSLRELDRLMGRIAMRSVDPEQTLESVANILDQIVEIVNMGE